MRPAIRLKEILIEILCHFQRSRNASLAGRRKHPNFSVYATHWLFADRCIERSDVLAHLKAQVAPRALAYHTRQVLLVIKKAARCCVSIQALEFCA